MAGTHFNKVWTGPFFFLTLSSIHCITKERSVSAFLAQSWARLQCMLDSIKADAFCGCISALQGWWDFVSFFKPWPSAVMGALFWSVVVKRELSKKAKRQSFGFTGPFSFQPSPMVITFGLWPKEWDHGYRWLKLKVSYAGGVLWSLRHRMRSLHTRTEVGEEQTQNSLEGLCI